MHLSPWALAAGRGEDRRRDARIPAWTPLKRKVLGLALRYAGAPYVWGGTSPDPQSPLGSPVAGGFDCSGFVWWVHEAAHLHRRRATPGAGERHDPGRARPTTWPRAAGREAHPPRASLQPGDILFWSSAPNGVNTSSATVYHTGIYLGNGWTINSHGSGDGVTLDYMGPGAGWFHDAFAFGWRVMPLHR